MNKTLDARTLILIFDNGVDENGDPIYVRKSIKNINQTATDEQLFDVGSKLADLCLHTLKHVSIDEDFILLPL